MNITDSLNLSMAPEPIAFNEAEIITKYCAALDDSITLIILLAFASYFIESLLNHLIEKFPKNRFNPVLQMFAESAGCLPFFTLGFLSWHLWVKGMVPDWIFISFCVMTTLLLGFVIYNVVKHFNGNKSNR